MTNDTLTDTQRVVLAAAAARDDGAVLPLPTTLKLAGVARDRLLGALLDRQLLVERSCLAGEPVWRRREDGATLALDIAEAGLLAIGINPLEPGDGTAAASTAFRPESAPNEAGPSPAALSNAAPQVAAPSKQDAVLTLLRSSVGGNISGLMQITGWQAHSVRGFLSGTVKKKLGLEVISAVEGDRGRVYRIASNGAPHAGGKP